MTLAATNLACERNGRLIFSKLSFTLAPGECAELRGANGAGKSSLLRLLAGLVPAAAGGVNLQGERDLPQNLHYIAHQDAMKPALTVAENLRFWCAILGGDSVEPAINAFSLANLRDDEVQLLSAGQRRRLTLARLFLNDRPLWLLDEPMTALDAHTQDQLRDHMRNHLASGGMILAATHGDLGLTPNQTIQLGNS